MNGASSNATAKLSSTILVDLPPSIPKLEFGVVALDGSGHGECSWVPNFVVADLGVLDRSRKEPSPLV